MTNPPLINGREYGWSDIICAPAGITVFGIEDISYEESQDMDNLYGAGNAPVARGFGRKTFSGSITLQMIELERLQTKSPSGRIQDIPEFPIIVSFLPEGSAPVTHKLQLCRFKNNGRSSKEGDMKIAQKIDLVIGNIDWK